VLKIVRSVKNEHVILTLLQTEEESLTELKRVIGDEAADHPLILDLKGRDTGELDSSSISGPTRGRERSSRELSGLPSRLEYHGKERRARTKPVRRYKRFGFRRRGGFDTTAVNSGQRRKSKLFRNLAVIGAKR
jgi:hypothetical protein